MGWIVFLLVLVRSTLAVQQPSALTPPAPPLPKQASTLLSCLSDHCHERARWWHMEADVPSCLSVRRLWWSAHEPRLQVTLVTQLSFDRLSAVQAQCEAWAGPLAAVVYIPVLHKGNATEGIDLMALNSVDEEVMQDAENMIDQMFSRMEAAASGARLHACMHGA